MDNADEKIDLSLEEEKNKKKVIEIIRSIPELNEHLSKLSKPEQDLIIYLAITQILTTCVLINKGMDRGLAVRSCTSAYVRSLCKTALIAIASGQDPAADPDSRSS